MAQAVLRVTDLPDAPLDAAAAFHASWLAQARGMLGDADSLVIAFPGGAHPHQAWRLAAVQALAREVAPKRVNAVEGQDGAVMDSILAYLASASGVTGQLLTASAGNPA